VRAVGLCFSDLKLLKQFSDHPRKGPVVDGIDPSVLESLPSYVPGEKPTVPGHEVAAEIVAVGEDVQHHRVGETVMVQADYRPLKTHGSNGAFGYNFEGGLQEYILTDERVVMDGEQRFLIPVDGTDEHSASAVALVEPWACVENSYVTLERNRLKPGGNMLVVVEPGRAVEGIDDVFDDAGKPARVTMMCGDEQQVQAVGDLGLDVELSGGADDLPDEHFDDILYFGTSKQGIDSLNDKLAAGGIFNIILDGCKIGEPISVGVGRVHYGGTRWIGTTSSSAAVSYHSIPNTGEVRPGDRVMVIGAGGPMGQMHTIRDICCGMKNVSVVATDFDSERLAALEQKAAPFAREQNVPLELINPKNTEVAGEFTYFALMAPVGELVAQSIADADEGALINIFAGIPAPTRHELDMDAYITKRCFMFGTSGSRITDMKIVLTKVLSNRLDTNCSVDAICGMAGAAEGISAVENRSIAGKIIVYPQLTETGLIPLDELEDHYPSVAAKLAEGGLWTAKAEKELLKVGK
jgi:threonine dehydrogenase-like Zn-dependent dehydrogenase